MLYACENTCGTLQQHREILHGERETLLVSRPQFTARYLCIQIALSTRTLQGFVPV